jgi:hypothetical protein
MKKGHSRYYKPAFSQPVTSKRILLSTTIHSNCIKQHALFVEKLFSMHIYKLHNEELHILYQVKADEMGRTCSTNGKKLNVCRILVGDNRRNETTRPGRRWVDNNKMDLKGIG